MNSRFLIVLGLLSAACGARPPGRPTLDEARSDAEARLASSAVTPADYARAGWLRLFSGDSEGAAVAFARAGDAGALGQAWRARVELDHRRALEAAARAAHDAGWAGLVARLWAQAAADALPDGVARLSSAWPSDPRRALTASRHTVRISFLPFLDLGRLQSRAPAAEGDHVRALGALWGWQVKPPRADRDGLVLTEWPLDPGIAHLEIDVDGPLVAWRDGRVVCATAHRADVGVVRFDAPGDGPLWTVWAADELPKAWRWSRPAPPPPSDLDPVERFLQTEAALLDRDVEAAQGLLSEAPEGATFAVQRARLVALDPGVPAAARRDRARALWEAALPLPWARLELARLLRQEDPVGARAHLEAITAPDVHAVHLERFRLDLDAGDREAAGEALAAATRSAPDPCIWVDEQASWLETQGDVRARAGLVETLVGCDKPLEAAELLLDLGRAEDARRRLEPLAASRPDDAAVRRARVRAATALGHLDEARTLLVGGDDAASRLRLADLDLAAADPAGGAAAFAPLLERHPAAHEAVELAAAWPEWSRFAALALDTEAVVRDFESRTPLSGPAVRVLDHTTLFYFADGHSLRRVHEIVAVRSREAAEALGEIDLPDGARPVALYTRKADGRRIDAEETPEKTAVSMRDLEAGDYVVSVYLKAGDNGYLYDRGWMSPRVYFQHTELPIHRQRLEVFAPDGRAPRVHGTPGRPAGTPVSFGERAGVRFDVERVPLATPEPEGVAPALWLPWIRVGQGVELVDDVAYWRDRVLARRRVTARFEAWARAAAGDGTARERALRLARAVREAVDDEPGLLDEDVSRMIESGHGNRALLFSAAAEVVGVPHTLLLARPVVHDDAGPFLQMADFPYPLVRIDEAEPWWLDPGPDRAAPGWLGAALLGGDAIAAWPPDTPAHPGPLPTERTVDDRRVVEMTLDWLRDGSLTGEVVDRLEGQEAAVIGAYLARLEPELRPRLVERLLVPVVGAARVVSLEDPVAAAPPDGPLTLRYRFEAKPGDTLDLGLFPVAPGRTWAATAERVTPMLVHLPTDQRVEVTVRSERPLKVEPHPGRRAEGRHRFVLEVDADDDEVTLTTQLRVAPGLIEPDDYLRFAHWARQVDVAERVRLRTAP